MTNFEKELAYHRKALEKLQRQKAKSRPPKKVISNRPKGRPRIDEKRLEKARQLAQKMPLPSVAMKLDIALSSLYRYNIKRKVLNAEKETMPEGDSPAKLSPGQLID